MAVPERREHPISFVLLRATRTLVTAPAYRALSGAIALAYGLAALIVGGMLQISASGGGTAPFLWIVPREPGMAWYFPAILAGGPYFLLILPIISTVLMLVTAAGVGLGMSAAVYLGVRVLRPLWTEGSGASVTAVTAGLTPAMLVLLTLGACCGTTAAASAGIVVMAQASGTSTTAVLVNTWYLGFFQVAMVYVALLAQEQLIVVNRPFFDAKQQEESTTAWFSGRAIVGGVVRFILIASGLLWVFSAFTVWFTVPMATTPIAAWFSILIQHVIPGSLAVLAGLIPKKLVGVMAGRQKVWVARAGRGLSLVCGTTLLSWLPPSFAERGAPGLLNEMCGFWGWSSGWGAVTPPSSDPWTLGFRWVLGFGLLGGFALALALRPASIPRVLCGRSAPRYANGPSPPAGAKRDSHPVGKEGEVTL